VGGRPRANAVVAAFYGGKAAADAIQRYGLFAAAGVVVLLVGAWLAVHFGKERLEKYL
jgi:hypothetical protein